MIVFIIQVVQAFESNLGVSSTEVGIVVASDIELGPLQPFSASRLLGTCQILPHPSLVIVGSSRPPLQANKGYDPFPRELRLMDSTQAKQDVYQAFFPSSPEAAKAWFIVRIL